MRTQLFAVVLIAGCTPTDSRIAVAESNDLGIVSLPAARGHIETDALRAIGVGGEKRSLAIPDVPTLAEQGLAGYDVSGWFAVVGPAKLPAAEVKRIRDAFVAAYAAPEVREAMARQGNEIQVGSPEAAAERIRAEIARYSALAKKIGVTAD